MTLYRLLLLLTVVLLVRCESAPDPDTSGTADSLATIEPQLRQKADSLAERLIARTDSTFRGVQPLTSAEQSRLRRYLNEEHLVSARRLGIEPLRDRTAAGELLTQSLEESGVVRLRTNDYCIVDPRMGYAVPLAVPPAAHLVDRIGHRFQQDLLELELPPYRFILTNVLRTALDQAHLRGRNVNAAQGTSTHEYGTTLDIYYDRFHYAPVHDSMVARPASEAGLDKHLVEQRLREAYRGFGEEYAPQISGVLGRVILELQDEGLLKATYERRQPVFHLTVARDVPALPEAADPQGDARWVYANIESQLTDVSADIKDLEKGSSERPEDVQEAIESLRGKHDDLLARLEDARRTDSQELAQIQEELAVLEGRLARTELLAEEDAARARRLIGAHVRHAERTLAQLNPQVEQQPDLGPLQRHLSELQERMDRIDGTSGTAFEEARIEAADALEDVKTDLERISAAGRGSL